jgi:hypothetical protein
VTSRGAARDRETRRRRESVGTDSRVLRLETPVGASLEASGANFFSLGESFDVGVNARAKTRARGAALAHSLTQQRTTRRDKNPHFIGISASCRIFCV